MNPSMNLMTAQISFLEGRHAVIHIPLPHYPFFLQPITRLLFGEDHDEDAHKIPWPYRHHFLNLSITPVECSVVCSRELADRFFSPLVDRFNSILRETEGVDPVQISAEDFHVIQVDGQGLDAGQRVLELTYPLALAGISILFETTYFSDYILVPHKSVHLVVKTLEERGFSFSSSVSAYVSEHSPTSPRSPLWPRQVSAGNPYDFSTQSLPSATTAPTRNIRDLQRRTFARLKQGGTNPTVDPTIRLVSCAGRREAPPSLNASLRSDLLQILLATCPSTAPAGQSTTKPGDVQAPDLSSRFLSLTLTLDEPISLLLETCLLSNPHLSLPSALLFSQTSPEISLSTLDITADEEAEGRGRSGKEIDASGGTASGNGENGDDVLIPITLDLRELPLEATGIVCGVAGRLAQGSSLATRDDHATFRSASKGGSTPPSSQAMSASNPKPISQATPPLSRISRARNIRTDGAVATKLAIPAADPPELYIDEQAKASRSRQGSNRLHAGERDGQAERTGRAAAADDDAKEPLSLDISFLSTARAGTVIVRESDLKQAVRALELELARGDTWAF